jgi:hypothetical protein
MFFRISHSLFKIAKNNEKAFRVKAISTVGHNKVNGNLCMYLIADLK